MLETPCRQCGKVYQRDWDVDNYVGSEGAAVETVEVPYCDPTEVMLFLCSCGRTIAVSLVEGPGGGETLYVPAPERSER